MKFKLNDIKKYTPIILATIIFLIIIAIVDITLSRFNKNQPSPTPQIPDPTLSPTYLQDLPTRYKDQQIPKSVYEQGFSKYRNQAGNKVHDYVLNRVERYYIYKDIIAANNLDYRLMEEFSFAGMEKEIPNMENAIRKSLIKSVDFAYIRVKYKNIIAAKEAQSRYGDLKKQAEDLIEKYSVQLESGIEPQEVVARSNSDQIMLILNDNQLNEYKIDYTPEQRLFYTDPGFQSYLYNQPIGTTSKPYQLKDANGQTYALIIVFVTKKHGSSYSSFDELYNTYRINFNR